jgi:hypothetical protein
MAAITATEFSINAGGDIRTSASPQIHTVLELHEWLQAMADDANSTGDDVVSILTANPSKLDGPRSAIKPMLLNLLGTFNIDATAAQYFKFGSISQNSGQDLYTGVKSIGSPLVAGSPIYIVQNAAKLTTYWPAGHIQILVKAITAGTAIDSGDIRVYSRKYGQTYGDFAANLIAGGEQPAAISTAVTDWTPLNLAAALALNTKVTITTGAHFKDTGDGSGSKEYKGTITLSGGCTIAEAAQYCQAICDESSTTTIDGQLGWKFRMLGNGTYSYTPNGAAPFGTVAGGKWFVAQGWYIAGALAGDLQKYQMISHDGTTVSNPVVAGISIGGLTVGARVLVGRDSGTGFVTNEYTLSAATTSGGNTCVMVEAIKTDTPDTGYIRVNGVPYTYTAINRGTKTFTISGTWGQVHAISSPAWCPFIDKVAASTTEASSNYTYASTFTARLKVRLGSGSALQPFETTFSAGSSATNGTNAIATSDL